MNKLKFIIPKESMEWSRCMQGHNFLCHIHKKKLKKLWIITFDYKLLHTIEAIPRVLLNSTCIVFFFSLSTSVIFQVDMIFVNARNPSYLVGNLFLHIHRLKSIQAIFSRFFFIFLSNNSQFSLGCMLGFCYGNCLN